MELNIDMLGRGESLMAAFPFSPWSLRRRTSGLLRVLECVLGFIFQTACWLVDSDPLFFFNEVEQKNSKRLTCCH